MSLTRGGNQLEALTNFTQQPYRRQRSARPVCTPAAAGHLLLSTARCHTVGEGLEGSHGGIPVDTSIGDGNTVLELIRLPLHQILAPLVDVGLYHAPEDGLVSCSQLVGDILGNDGLHTYPSTKHTNNTYQPHTNACFSVLLPLTCASRRGRLQPRARSRSVNQPAPGPSSSHFAHSLALSHPQPQLYTHLVLVLLRRVRVGAVDHDLGRDLGLLEEGAR